MASSANFYPRPPRGGRQDNSASFLPCEGFLSTPSARRATEPKKPRSARTLFLSTPSARRATAYRLRAQMFLSISIHALREEGDYLAPHQKSIGAYFYPRPPRGGRPVLVAFYGSTQEFLSTPSARRATRAAHPGLSREEISIHALREEGDLQAVFSLPQRFNFYPRPPRGGRHDRPVGGRPCYDFYPRPPRGGRQQKQRQNLYFQTNYTTFCTNLEEP